TWCAANIAKAPDIGWLREVDFRLASLALTDGDQVKAQDYLRQSGYKSFDKPVVLTTPFSEDPLSGHAFASRRIAEIVPGRFYARSNYQEEIAGDINGPESIAKHFFGERFNLEDVRNFRPDATVDRPTELKVGGTRIDLFPVHGGETRDAMFIHLPDLGVLFVGDFIMP